MNLTRSSYWVANPAAGLRKHPASPRTLEAWAIMDGYNAEGRRQPARARP